MTDNIFEIETTAIAHVACAPQESGILLTEFAAAYPSVNHSWIFHVLEKAELPRFMCRFLQSIYVDSNTEVEFAWENRGHFLMTMGRQARLSSEWFPICKWRSIQSFDGSRTRSFQKTLPFQTFFNQPSPCAYADDFAVAASSFRLLMTALSPAFVVVDRVAGLTLDHRKCCWVQYGSDSCHELLNWVVTNCEEFRETKIVKYAKYVGTMIGPEGYLHRWTAPREKISREPGK